MIELVKIGQSIEGKKITGQSRKPLLTRGLRNYDGANYFTFVAKFDVRAQVTQTIDGEPAIEKDANTSVDVKIICKDALIKSTKEKWTTDVTTGSAKHKTNMWKFPQQTSVRVTASHQGIALAEVKRSCLENQTHPPSKQLKS